MKVNGEILDSLLNSVTKDILQYFEEVEGIEQIIFCAVCFTVSQLQELGLIELE